MKDQEQCGANVPLNDSLGGFIAMLRRRLDDTGPCEVIECRFGRDYATALANGIERLQIERDNARLLVSEGNVAIVELGENVEELEAEIERLRKDAERYRAVKSMFRKNDAYDRYGDGAHWACGFFTHDGRLDLDAAIDALVTPNTGLSGAGPDSR